jgi:hypothetical protein
MTYTYKLLANNTDPITAKTTESTCILRKEDNAFIPKDETNTDYQKYLEWVAKGNTAEAAD